MGIYEISFTIDLVNAGVANEGIYNLKGFSLDLLGKMKDRACEGGTFEVMGGINHCLSKTVSENLFNYFQLFRFSLLFSGEYIQRPLAI